MAYPALTAYQTAGLTKDLPKHMVFQYTGFDPSTGKWDAPMKGIGLAIALIAASKLGGRVANMSGANRYAKKMTGGLLKIA